MLGKIAIVGANGFVGRHLLEHAAREGIAVVGVVRSEIASAEVRSRGGVPVLVSDLGDEAMRALVPQLAGCEGLVYTASVSVGPSAPDRTDPAGLLNVVEACREAGVSRIAFFSGLGIAHYGINPHCTNPYFLAKMAGEVALFRSLRGVTVFRPSYIFGPGDEFLSPLIAKVLHQGTIEIPGDGQYRLQPVSVRDAARAALATLAQEPVPRVVDLVGPEVLSYRALIGRVARVLGREIDIQERPLREALELARQSDYQGLRPNDLACLLCDEVSDPARVVDLVGGKLESLDTMIAWSARTATGERSES